jgi:hypothetical protein
MNATHCDMPDCPITTGGKCWRELGPIVEEVVRELRNARKIYDLMESNKELDTMETPPRPFVTWRGWKMIRNPISDRIEELTGGSRI